MIIYDDDNKGDWAKLAQQQSRHVCSATVCVTIGYTEYTTHSVVQDHHYCTPYNCFVVANT